MDAETTRCTISRATSIYGGFGIILETAIIEALHRACSGTSIRVIRGFDFSPYDCAIVDTTHAQEPFPESEPISSFERLCWAYRNQGVAGSLCDVKSCWPKNTWLDGDAADVFLICFVECPDRLYAVPRSKVDALYSAAYSVRLTRPEVATTPQASCPSLAPYSVLKKDYYALLLRLVHEQGPGDGLLGWKTPSPRPLEHMFRFRDKGRQMSFEALLRLYRWIQGSHPAVRFHHVHTQWLTGNFVIESGSTRLRIQHKVNQARKFRLGQLDSPANSFDLLMVHKGPVDQGFLEVSLRYEKEGVRFEYDEDGADQLVRYLDTHKRAALKAHVETMAHLLNEKIPPLPDDRDPFLAYVRREEEFNGRTRQRSHQIAMHLYRYINSDPDNLGLDLACIYLNWDQEHPFGAAIVVQHLWSDEERATFRETKELPPSLQELLPSLEQRDCAVLWFAPREFRHLYISNLVFPLQQLSAELPVTEQKFFLIAPPDEALPDHMPETILLFPSELIEFPKKAKAVWEENKKNVRQGHQTEYQLALLMGHTQDSAGIVKSMLRRGTALPDFWVTPKSAAQHLHKLLQSGEPDMAICPLEAYDLTRLHRFQKASYITTTRAVLQASIDLGAVRSNSPEDHRAYGYWQKEREREAARKARIKSEGEADGKRQKPGGRRPRTAKQRREAKGEESATGAAGGLSTERPRRDSTCKLINEKADEDPRAKC